MYASNLEASQLYKICLKNPMQAKMEIEEWSVETDSFWPHGSGVLEWLCNSHWCFAVTNKQETVGGSCKELEGRL